MQLFQIIKMNNKTGEEKVSFKDLKEKEAIEITFKSDLNYTYIMGKQKNN